MDGDRDADANVGAETLGASGWRKGDIAGIEEGIEAVLANRMPLYPEVGDGFVEVDLGEEAIGGVEAVVDEAAEGVDALEIRASKGWLEVERNRAASRCVGGREQSPWTLWNLYHMRQLGLHAEGITPPGRSVVSSRDRPGGGLGRDFDMVEGDTGEASRRLKEN